MYWDDVRARVALRRIFDAAVCAADPKYVLARHLPEQPKGRVVVVGAGKSAAAMAAALETAWPDVALTGAVVTRYGHGVRTRLIEVIEAAHPVPDANGERAARRILNDVNGLTKHDLVIALISGGGSALMALPAPGLTLADKQAINHALLSSGATIREINVVRKQLSAIKGGRLAMAAAPARIVTLAISDVPGDDPQLIASGPTVADHSTAVDARDILARYRIGVSPVVAMHLSHNSNESLRQTLPNAEFHLIATPAMALRAAASEAVALGLKPTILGDALEGESREVGKVMAGIAMSVQTLGEPLGTPAVLLSGGETTVTLGAGEPGRGGRNTEFILSLALNLSDQAGIWALAGDSDGIDGSEDAAGAIVSPNTLARATSLGIDPRSILDGHDSYSLFKELGDLVVTGPTLTNVNDIRAILVS